MPNKTTKSLPKKSGFAAIIGLPNAGKSTLIRLLFGQKLSIISPKAQTTRYALNAIYNDEECQIVFIDTPGIIAKKGYLMHEKMMKELEHAADAADIFIAMIDASREQGDTIELLKPWIKNEKPVVVLLNKNDIAPEDKAKLYQDQLQRIGFKQIIPFSARLQKDKQKLLQTIKPLLPHDHLFYEDTEQLSDRHLRFFCGEFIREQLYFFLSQELPYESAVVVHAYQEKERVTVIYADIVVSKQSQKIIVIGKDGEMIRRIGSAARQSIEKFIEKKVYLELRVKVREDWRKKPSFLREYGFSS